MGFHLLTGYGKELVNGVSYSHDFSVCIFFFKKIECTLLILYKWNLQTELQFYLIAINHYSNGSTNTFEDTLCILPCPLPTL